MGKIISLGKVIKKGKQSTVVLTINNLSLCLIWLVLITICYSDIRYRIIANYKIVFLFFIILINFLLGDGELNYLGTTISLLIGFAFFYFGLAGAGDIKLIAILILSLPVQYIGTFLIIMAFCGIPLALYAIVKKMITKNKKVTLPYGVAISISYVITSSTGLII